MKSIVIVGAGDLGREIVWLIEDINKVKPTYVILGFLDDDEEKVGKEFFGYKVLGKLGQLEELRKKTPLTAVLAIQQGSIRKKIVEEHSDFSHWESIIHPSAVVAVSSSIGTGSILFPQVTVSVGTRLGRFGLYYIRSTVCNDCNIGDYVSIMSGTIVLEDVEVGDECFLSAGSCIHPQVKIGKRSHIGIKATVKADCGENSQINE
nr:hypothetical protein [Clostridia bacterium]